MNYEAMAAANGELRLQLVTSRQADSERLQMSLTYAYAYGREHRVPADPWEYTFADPRPIRSESEFLRNEIVSSRY